MRKLILNLAVSLDGFIEGPHGEYDWCMTDQDYGMTEFLNNTDAIFFGRKSFELLKSVDANAYPDKKKYVFSHTMSKQEPGVTVINGNIEKSVQEIKNEPGKNIWVFGGASLTESLMEKNLIDEFMLSVHPLLLGVGKPLFTGLKNRVKLRLKNSITYTGGLVQLYYEFDVS